MTEPDSLVDFEVLDADLGAAGRPWVAGPTELALAPQDEQIRRLGVPLPSDDERRIIQARAAQARRTSTAADLPNSFDLRHADDFDYTTAVRDQGSCGSCVAFAVVAAIEGTARYTRRVPTLDIDLAEAQLFHGYGSALGVSCATGWLPLPAFQEAAKGVGRESDWPYSAASAGGPPAAQWQDHRAAPTGITEATGDRVAIKQHLLEYGAVTGCFEVFSDFFAYSSGVYQHVSGSSQGGHCVCLIGWDDSKDAWIIKNSWGTGWGEAGFGLIKYGSVFIDSWQNVGATGVNLRNWSTPKRVLGAYSSADARNGWVYLSDTGWLKVGGDTDTAHLTLFTDLLAAKNSGALVNAFYADGLVHQVYAY